MSAMLHLPLGCGLSWGLLEQGLGFVCCAVRAYLTKSFVVSAQPTSAATHPPEQVICPATPHSAASLAVGSVSVLSNVCKVWWLFFSILDQNSKHLFMS